MTISTALMQLIFSWDVQSTVGGTVGDFVDTLKLQTALTDGTGAAQVKSLYYEKTRTIAALTNYDLDLAGVLADVYGATITFTSIKALIIRNKDSAQDLTIGGAANPFILFSTALATETCYRGGFVARFAPGATGMAVTAGTGDILRIRNGNASGSIDCEILIAGNV